VFSVFSLFEAVFDMVVFWLPFYYEIKLLLLVALQFPQLNLAATLYNSYIRPFLKKNEKQIDSVVSDAGAVAAQKLHEVAVNAAPKVISAAATVMASSNTSKKE